jgi:hypothetical protein
MSAQVKDQINAMINLSAEQVLSCMGPPTTKAREGSTEVWTYSSFGGVTTSAALAGNQYGAFGSATTSQEFCIVNLTMRDGFVVYANYRSQGKLLAPSLPCYPVLSACTAGRLATSGTTTTQTVAEKSNEAAAFCRELCKDPRLDPIRAVIALFSAPTLSQQTNPDFIKDEQLQALEAYKEILGQCRSKIATANPQLFKIMMQVQPAPYENLKLLHEKKITIGQYNTRKKEGIDKLQAAIVRQGN